MMQNVNSPTYVDPPATTWLISIGAAILVCYLVFAPLLICDELPEAQGKWREKARKQCEKYFNYDPYDHYDAFLLVSHNPYKAYDLNNSFIDAVNLFIKDASLEGRLTRNSMTENLLSLFELAKVCNGKDPSILSRTDGEGNTAYALLDKAEKEYQTSQGENYGGQEILKELIGLLDPGFSEAVPPAEAPLGGGEAGSYGQGTAAAALFGGVATCAAPRAAAGTSSAQGGSSSSSSSSSDDEEEAAAAPPLGSVQSQPDGRSSFRSS